MGWRYGQSIHAQKDRTHDGLVNPLHVNGMSVTGGQYRAWVHTDTNETHDCFMGWWKDDDEHYPSKHGQPMRPGLGSNPVDDFGQRLKFDLTTRSEQSRRHQPEMGKIILRDGRSFYPEELKKVPCMNTPSCKSQRTHSLQSRQKNLCDVCLRKQKYCQSNTARSRRTERRREARLQEQSSSGLQISRAEPEYTPPPSNASSGRMIKSLNRSSWRRPCVRGAKIVLLGDSQVIYHKLFLLYNNTLFNCKLQVNRLNVLLDPNAIQIGYSGADCIDLCYILDFGRMDSINSCYNTNRNYVISHWEEYKNKRER